MALTRPTLWGLLKPKPVDAKGTAAAFAAGDRVFKKTGGATPALKQIVKLSLDNDKKANGLRKRRYIVLNRV
jgi:hypothetical protein